MYPDCAQPSLETVPRARLEATLSLIGACCSVDGEGELAEASGRLFST